MNLLEKIDKYIGKKNTESNDYDYYYENQCIYRYQHKDGVTVRYKAFSSYEKLENWLDEQLKEDEELSYKDDWLLGLPLSYKNSKYNKTVISGKNSDVVIIFSGRGVSYNSINKEFTLINGSEITYKNFLKWRFEENKKYEDDYERQVSDEI